MKFVALALALLLAVGSHAASLQADAPNQLDHIRSVMNVYMAQVKDSANKALDHLDDAEYSELKTRVSGRIEEMFNQIKALQVSVAPITDTVVTTISDATADFRSSVMTDIDNLKADLEPKRVALKEVLDRHIDQYYQALEPLITEYSSKHQADMEVLRVKMEPIVEDMRNKVMTNVEETKDALMPIVEAVRTKLSERLNQLKVMVSPYVTEYKDQLKQAYDQAHGINTDDLAALKEKITPLADDIKIKLNSIFEIVAASINKS
ncbi:apolipoprotein A-I-like [Anoplopoma fimbria]|uniref:Apolipoprotein A-I n=1 Tax=Anoplopoma fimbria TaxID=229290 RepID=C3KJ42_ANOFI|nr:apolipoprotein A-I-like [Anoplopoma fimbria]ACQ58664.1 Apolipoprotein A-I precursor [Anoplopoma fimbria]